MKKFLLIAGVVVSLLSSTSYAQINLGIKGGLNYCTNEVRFSNGSQGIRGEDYGYRASYHVGVYTRIMLLKKFSVNPELLFSSKGFRVDDQFSKSKMHLNYLSLPVLAGVQPLKKLTVLAGPEFGLLLSARSKTDSQNTDASGTWENRFDLGMALGVRYDITEKIMVGLRYTHGLSSVVKPFNLRDIMNNELDSEVRFENRAFQVSVGYQFH